MSSNVTGFIENRYCFSIIRADIYTRYFYRLVKKIVRLHKPNHSVYKIVFQREL